MPCFVQRAVLCPARHTTICTIFCINARLVALRNALSKYSGIDALLSSCVVNASNVCEAAAGDASLSRGQCRSDWACCVI